MKDNETKLAFIKARAEGKSYSTIQKELGIAKATCTSWEQTLKADIEAMKRASTEELYTAYNMKREARIKALGEIVKGLDTAIASKPLEELPLDKLLELRLKYGDRLREEYIEPVEITADNTLDSLLEQYNQLYIDSKAGKYSPVDVKSQLAILDAKKEILYQIAHERKNEEEDLDDLALAFKAKPSRLLRHEEEDRAGA